MVLSCKTVSLGGLQSSAIIIQHIPVRLRKDFGFAGVFTDVFDSGLFVKYRL
jgi:hypothetical protein